MEISTDRLLLRPYKASDLPHVQRYAVRPEFYRYLPIAEQTAETVAEFLKRRLEEQQCGNGDGVTFAIEPREVGFVVGGVRLGVRDQPNRQGDLGFALASDYQGRGYMTEAVKAVLVLGFDRFALHRIWATADVENERS